MPRICATINTMAELHAPQSCTLTALECDSRNRAPFSSKETEITTVLYMFHFMFSIDF